MANLGKGSGAVKGHDKGKGKGKRKGSAALGEEDTDYSKKS